MSYYRKKDGKKNKETCCIANKIEYALAETLDIDAVYGMVLNTNLQDLKSALEVADNYKKAQIRKKVARDENFYKLSKILISKV